MSNKPPSPALAGRPGSPQLKKPSMEKIKARMVECRRSFKLNFSNMNMWEIPLKFVHMAKHIGITLINEINLTKNHFQVLPLDMAETKHMRVLILKNNRFAEIPRIAFTFNKLQVLDASDNFIKDIDMTLSSLSNIKEIDFTNNLLVGSLPCFWSNMPFLISINVSKNKLTAIPASIELAKSLMKLNVSENDLTSLPASLGKLSELVELDVHMNRMTALPSTLGHLKNMQSLECMDNPLTEPGLQLYLQGFFSYMGYLRTQFQEEQLESKAIERPGAQSVGSYKRYYTKSELNNWPVARTGHSVTQALNVTYMFGGFINKYGRVDELYGINYLTLIWGRPVTNGDPPSCRDGHAAAFDGTHRLFFFGGRSEEQKLLNDFYYLDLRCMSWVKPLLEGASLHAREGASMVAVGDKIMIFGGRGAKQRFNDLHILDAKTWTWNPQTTRGSRPNPRQNAAMVVKDNILYIHGGRSDLIFDDMYVMSTVNFIWIKVNQTGLEPRYGHTAKIMNNKFYIVGGMSKSGAAKTSMFFMGLPPVDNLEEITSQQAMLLPLVERMQLAYHETHSWIEIDTELSPKPASSFCFHKDLLLVLQNRDDSEEQVTVEGFADSAVWDVYLETDAATLKPKVLPPKKSKPPDTKSSRVAELLADETKLRGLPRSYQFLTDADIRLQDHVQKWQKRFEQLYRDRRAWRIVIQNEAGIPKFLSSVIRPSQLKYPEFFYWEGLCDFLPGFLKYEPLENPLDFPKYLPSPSTILQWAKADSFDFATVMVSLLLGVGYNAMCVCGYAPIDITTCNEKNTKFDISKLAPPPKKIEAITKLGHHDKHVSLADVPKKYDIIVQPIFNAMYLEKKRMEQNLLRQKFVADFNDTNLEPLIDGQTDNGDLLISFLEKNAYLPIKENEINETNPVVHAPLLDPLDTQRLHCWIIIFKGDREMADTFYLEPTTGIGDISWDLKNINLWEPVLDEATQYVEDPAIDPTIAFGKKSEEEHEIEQSTPSKKTKDFIIKKNIYGDIASYHWFHGVSWIPKLEIPVDNYVKRCPKGCKKTLYDHCAHIMFAFYGNYMRWDGLIERLVYYEDHNYKDLIECHDFYERRKDMLKKRVYFIKQMKVMEVFGPGTTSGIKIINIIEGTSRSFEYYPQARIDGLQTREEVVGRMVKETFEHKESGMVYRSVVYALPSLPIANESLPDSTTQSFDPSLVDRTTKGSDSVERGSMTQGSVCRGSVVSKRSSMQDRKSTQATPTKRRTSKSKICVKRGKAQPSIAERLQRLQEKKNNQASSVCCGIVSDQLLPIVKITQKYGFRNDVNPSDNIAKKVFRISLQQIRVDYHFVHGRITNNTKVYEKDGSYSSMHVDPFLEKMGGFAQIDEYHHLQIAEKESIQGVREAEQDVIELLEQRAREEQCIVLMTPFSDIAQMKKDDLVEEVSKVETDYLSPHFPVGIKPRQHLSRPQMLIVRENCIRALRDKHVARAAIIQARYEEETSALAKARANYERDREGMTVAEEEEYEKSCEQAIFRIRILEERHAYHEEQSLKRYAEMNEKLKNDERLADLYTSED
ncbi:dynein regulatory complex subunit 7 isoform X5 [Physcomitrium patens]|uniref:dynein regulatory complex subunit 7 isoform X5 n=1 Tax=Physcomitrium patens TaxID=3218 RepID=UPI003CCDF3D1